MFLVVAGGSFWILIRSLAPAARQGGFLLAASFWAAILFMGFFESPYVIHRYVFHLNPLFVALFAITIADAAEWADGRIETAPAPWAQRRTARRWILGLVTAGVVLSTAEQADVAQAWKTQSRPYGRADLEDPDAGGRFWFDYDGCGEFLAEHAQPDDVVLLKDAVHYSPYGANPDARLSQEMGVWATDPAGRVVDWYLGIPFVRTLEEFDAAIARAFAEGRTCWVAYTREEPNGPVVHLPRDLLQRFESYQDRIVHVGRDLHTVIIRLDPPRRGRTQP
jgi:hypothetical protein